MHTLKASFNCDFAAVSFRPVARCFSFFSRRNCSKSYMWTQSWVSSKTQTLTLKVGIGMTPHTIPATASGASEWALMASTWLLETGLETSGQDWEGLEWRRNDFRVFIFMLFIYFFLMNSFVFVLKKKINFWICSSCRLFDFSL